ncbi:MAG: MarR family winged helix-turn-helix transcriptional regulator [Planctomycetota bacterium]
MLDTLTQQVMTLYPRIFFACHQRHARDPKARRALSAHQASVLDHLDQVAGTSLAELARHMGVKPSAMSIAVSRLVRQRYVTRAVDRVDRRRILLRLSAAGARIKESGSVLDPDRLRCLMMKLSEAEQREAVHGLALLARGAQELMREARVSGRAPRRSPA